MTKFSAPSSLSPRAGREPERGVPWICPAPGSSGHSDEYLVNSSLVDHIAFAHSGASVMTNQIKGEQVKVELAQRLRRETAMSLKWIARRLQMGTWTYVFNLLHEKRKQ
jgi:hypothetical protein